MLKKVIIHPLITACGVSYLLTDPEEFLNMLFKHTLKVDPFITIRFVLKFKLIMDGLGGQN